VIFYIISALCFGFVLGALVYTAEVKILKEENEMLKEDLLDCAEGRGRWKSS